MRKLVCFAEDGARMLQDFMSDAEISSLVKWGMEMTD